MSNLIETEVDIGEYQQLDRLGAGSYGEVYKVQNIINENYCAAKILKKENFKPRYFKREIDILSRIKHPAILSFIGLSNKNFEGEDEVPVIFTEFMQNGSLYDLIKSNKKSPNPKWNSTMKLINIYGIASGMSYLHANNIIHRDLKSMNILMDDYLYPKISDFGLSKILHTNESSMTSNSSTENGTLKYMPPEVLASDGNNKFTKKGDIYSFALIMYEILTNKIPYKDMGFADLVIKVPQGHRPSLNPSIPEQYKKLIESCWAGSPEDRPDFTDILKTLEGFLTDSIGSDIDKDLFLKYVEYIKQNEKDFDGADKKIILPSETKSQNTEKKLDFPIMDYKNLDDKNRELVQEAEKDPKSQFIVAKCLIEGDQGFPLITPLGIKYLEQSVEKGFIEAAIYYSRMLIDAKKITRDLGKAKGILTKLDQNDNVQINLLWGKIYKKEQEYNKAYLHFSKAAKKGEPEAQYELGKMELKGCGCKPNEKSARDKFKKSMNNGFEKSDNYLSKLESNTQNSKEGAAKPKVQKSKDDDPYFERGSMYFNGTTVKANKKEAARYYKMSADKKNINAMIQYAKMLKDGDGIDVNKIEAAKYLKMAADCGSEPSLFDYTCMLDDGDGIQPDVQEANKLYKILADKKNEEAMFRYALMNDEDTRFQRSKKEAIEYYLKLIDKGNSKAMNCYAVMLEEGDGIKADKKEAEKIYNKAIKKGNSNAMLNYAIMLDKNCDNDETRKKVVDLIQNSADKGNEDAIIEFAKMLWKGEGVKRNVKSAIQLLKGPVDNENDDAMTLLAIILYKKNNKKSKEEAKKYFEKAKEKGNDVAMLKYGKIKYAENSKKAAIYLYKESANRGNDKAMRKLADMLKNGDGIPKNINEALNLYSKAADKGNVKAMISYAEILLEGVSEANIPSNKIRAASYFRMAANLGNVDAMTKYAEMLRDGNGISKNEEEAKKYFKMADDENH